MGHLDFIHEIQKGPSLVSKRDHAVRKGASTRTRYSGVSGLGRLGKAGADAFQVQRDFENDAMNDAPKNKGPCRAGPWRLPSVGDNTIRVMSLSSVTSE